MAPSLELWCCSHFLREVRAVVASSPDLAGLTLQTLPILCLQGPQKERQAQTAFSLLPPPGACAIIGGGCLRGWPPAEASPAGTAVLAPEQCFHLVAPPALVDSLLAEGAYLLTQGWLAHWRQHIADWGFDQATAREFFQETTRLLVLLDTGLNGQGQAELAAMGEYLGIAWRVIPVGLDMLRLCLERLVLDLRRDGKAPLPQDRQFADHLMVIDLMADLLTASGEKEALGRVQTLFSLLFCPGRLTFTPAGQGPAGPAAPQEAGFGWTESGRGFVIRLRHRGEEIGSLELDDLAFAEYKERYLALALPLGKVCALAMANARAQEVRQKAEQAMRSMAGIVKSSEDAIIGQGLDGHIVSWNKGAERIYGYQEHDVLGRHISFLTPQDRPDETTRLLEHLKTGVPVEQVDTTWLARDGRLVAVSLRVSPIHDEGGRIVGASNIARDVTEEKRKAERERRALEAQLQQAQKLESVGRLAGGVAHDFNNMLAIILGYSELALDRATASPDLRKDLEEIQQAAERAKDLTRQLLAFARKQVLQMTNLSLGEVVANFSKMIKRLIGEDIETKISLDPNLPLIKADPSMLEQILLNLAVNARDAMPAGGTLTIEARAMQLDQNYATAKFEVAPGEYVMLAVSDTGVGINEQDRQMIFEPFFTTKGPGEGTGLGLSTVYGIVKQHGGNIWVYSEPGQGTTFKIYFPVAQEGEIAAEKQAEIPPRPASGETVLVVEDDPRLRALICSSLSTWGYQVVCAGSPSEAQAFVKGYPDNIHLMLTDVVMPEMNGKDLYDKIAALRPEIRVVFMSGYTEEVIAHRGVLNEGINFIQKPFSIKQLAHKLGTLLAATQAPA